MRHHPLFSFLLRRGVLTRKKNQAHKSSIKEKSPKDLNNTRVHLPPPNTLLFLSPQSHKSHNKVHAPTAQRKQPFLQKGR